MNWRRPARRMAGWARVAVTELRVSVATGCSFPTMEVTSLIVNPASEVRYTVLKREGIFGDGLATVSPFTGANQRTEAKS